MIEKRLVELQIPTEEVENVDALVSESYYGSRSGCNPRHNPTRCGAAQIEILAGKTRRK